MFYENAEVLNLEFRFFALLLFYFFGGFSQVSGIVVVGSLRA